MAKQASTGKRTKPRRRFNSGLTALVAVIFLLVSGAAALVYWLEASYDPSTDPFGRTDLADIGAPIDVAKPPVADATQTTLGDAQGGSAQGVHGDAPDQGDKGSGGQAPDTAMSGDSVPDQSQEVGAPTAPLAGDNAGAASPSAATDSSAVQNGDNQIGTNEPIGDQTDSVRGADGDGLADKDGTEPSPATTGEPTAEVARLTPAPQPDLVTPSPSGPLPVVSPDGRTPLAVYARPYEPSGRPRIAVVLTELGMAEAKTIAAIQQLPGPITLAFHPYGRKLQEYVDQARAAGHEVLLEIPMEPANPQTHDPGNYALLTSLPTRTNLENLDWLLGRFSGYVGVVNFMGERFTTSEPHLRPVLEAVRSRGLMYLDRRTSPRSIAVDIAQQIGLPGTGSDREIDSQASRAAIGRQLRELERLARSNGQAVGMAYPYPVTIELLSEWARGLRAKGIDLVPASALVRGTG